MDSFLFLFASLMEVYIAFFVAGREEFFKEKAWINCPIDRYCACDSADMLFDVDSVMRKKLVNVGQDVKITEPIKVEKGLITGDYIRASLSHQGILAVCAYSDSNHIIQFTNLNTNKQVKMRVEDISIIAFYDNMSLLLTHSRSLREGTVEEVFKDPRLKTFREIEGPNNAEPYTDVSLLNATRVLYYRNNGKLYSFNVDTKVNTMIGFGIYCGIIASFSGIDCGIKAVYHYFKCTYTLNNDNSVTKVSEGTRLSLSAIFPSTSNPSDINDAMFKRCSNLIKDGNMIKTDDLIRFKSRCSVVRIYKDIFLAYDCNTKSWVLVRILVP